MTEKKCSQCNKKFIENGHWYKKQKALNDIREEIKENYLCEECYNKLSTEKRGGFIHYFEGFKLEKF